MATSSEYTKQFQSYLLFMLMLLDSSLLLANVCAPFSALFSCFLVSR